MKYIILAFLAIFFWVSPISAQDFRSVSFEEFQTILAEEDGPTIVNFWATWCRPCVAELPHFEELNQKLENGNNVRILLVSLDFPDMIETKLKPFLVRKKMKSQVLLLDETDFDPVIRQIDEEWSGAIPATLFVNRRKNIKKFHEGELNADELLQLAMTTL